MEAKFDFIRYSNCWEDSENLLKALEIQGRRGASILSAGDNTLAMLLGDPESITAFDINPTQIHLFYLKKAGFEMLSHGDLLALLGIGGTDRSWELFQSLEPVMDPEAFQYFFGHPEFFEKGIVHIGKFERYFQIFRNRVVPLFTTKRKMAKLAEFHDVEAQKKYYDRWVNNRRMNAIFKVFFGFRMMGKLGRDRAFYNYVEDKENSAVNIKKTADSGMGRIPNWNNPYMTYVLTNRFTEDALPYYLQEQFHETIRSAVIADGQDPFAFAEQFCRDHPDAVGSANEVGSGIVPMAAEDRAFREAAGRVLCVIARNAGQVTRCVCGIGVRIK